MQLCFLQQVLPGLENQSLLHDWSGWSLTLAARPGGHRKKLLSSPSDTFVGKTWAVWVREAHGMQSWGNGALC